MQANPTKREPTDTKAFPGKMDHTTCLCIRVQTFTWLMGEREVSCSLPLIIFVHFFWFPVYLHVFIVCLFNESTTIWFMFTGWFVEEEEEKKFILFKTSQAKQRLSSHTAHLFKPQRLSHPFRSEAYISISLSNGWTIRSIIQVYRNR